MNPIRPVIALLAGLGVAACQTPPVNRAADAGPLPTVAYVDTDQYLGRWYEIARYPNSFEEGCEGVTADYGLRDDGLISVTNTCREGAPDGEVNRAEGRAKIVDTNTNAKLKVSFFGPFWGDYWIIDLDDDYSFAIVSEPKGRYLWLLSRTPTISGDRRAAAMEKLKSLGFNTDALYFTQQPPS
jgi:apolipoprotein D and lipocalin family protein